MPHRYEPGFYWISSPAMGAGTGKTGTPYLYIEGEVTHKQDGVNDDGTAATIQTPIEKRTVYLYVSEKAFQYTVDKLDALGWNGDFANPALQGEAANGIWAECRSETYEGKLREKWSLPGGGIEHTAPTNDIIRKLNAMYKARKGSAPKPGPGPKAPAPSQLQQEADLAF